MKFLIDPISCDLVSVSLKDEIMSLANDNFFKLVILLVVLILLSAFVTIYVVAKTKNKVLSSKVSSNNEKTENAIVVGEQGEE